MKTTVQYLNEAKERLGITSDNALAKHLKIARSAISQYQHGHRIIDDYAAVRIAEILGINPMDVIATANYEREKAPERKDFWRKMRDKGSAQSFTVNRYNSIYYDNWSRFFHHELQIFRAVFMTIKNRLAPAF